MKIFVKILLVLLVLSFGNGLQNPAAASFYKTTLPELNNAAQQQQQDSLAKPGNTAPLHKAYPPVNPGQPHPDRISPANKSIPRPLPIDTPHNQQDPRRHKVKLAGEQSSPQ